MNQIEVIGLGAGDVDQLSLGIYRQLIEAEIPLFMRTQDHPVVKSLEKEGIIYEAFDSIYQENDQFELVYQTIVSELISKANKHGKIRYAVPGHPMLAERTVQLLLEQNEVSVDIVGGQSYLDDLFTALKIDPIEGFQFIDATSFERAQVDYTHHIIFCQVYNQMIASEVKLELLEDLPPEHPVIIAEAVGSLCEVLKEVKLYELDRSVELSNLTSIYVFPIAKVNLNHQFFRLKEIIATLRGPDGCPWDKEQTHESLRQFLIEEAYELVDAIDEADDEKIIEELGDVLLQVMLHSQIGEEQGYFSIDDVIATISDKMIRRHPHVFGDVSVSGTKEVLDNWQTIKAKEKDRSTGASRLDRIPKAASTLVKADAIQKEANKVGFDWDDPKEIYKKIEEEIVEIRQALIEQDPKEIELEFGDLLFSVVNLARHYNVSSDLALRRANEKFTARFQYMERYADEKGINLTEVSLDKLDEIWDKAKEIECEGGESTDEIR